MIRVREAAVAGSFYPADSGELQSAVHRLLDAVPAPKTADADEGPVKALIVPHAGYVYSGPVAAAAFARLLSRRADCRRVVLLGPGHCVGFSGLAASSADAWRTPLGEVQLDRAVIASLGHPAVRVLDDVHRPEHSLEVQLPFLQSVLDSFLLVPLVVGDARAGDVADVLDLLWDGPETLILVSSDLSHYLPYEQACAVDRETRRAIASLEDGGIGHAHACGATPVRGLLIAARRHALRPVTLDLRNSGDTAGGRGRVVGYGAWMFIDEASCKRAA